jgi:predicted NAD/FAD-binding protein
VAARLLHEDNHVTVFEQGTRIGGHTNTVEVEVGGERHAVDTGFIVYNTRTYPSFTRLLSLLGVATHASEMSFSVACERSGLEYATASLRALFAQRRNLVRPSFHRMLRDVVRFNRDARALLACDPLAVSRRSPFGATPAMDSRPGLNGLVAGPVFARRTGELVHLADATLGDMVAARGYSRAFVDHYLVPMGAAIWSAAPARFLDFPALTFARFFQNHGLLQASGQPTWRVVTGGSSRYVEALVAPFADRIRTGCAVTGVRRRDAVCGDAGSLARRSHGPTAAPARTPGP